MGAIAKAEAGRSLAEIPAAITGGVQAAQALESACNRVNGLWQNAKAANDGDADWLADAAAEFGTLCGTAWGTAKPALIAAFDILAGGVGADRNALLDQLRSE